MSTNLKIMVWGCHTYHGVGTLAMIKGNMIWDKYIETINLYLTQQSMASCSQSFWEYTLLIPG
jgi:hypothetical protein